MEIVHHKISDLYKTLDFNLEKEVDFAIFSIPDIHPQIPFKSPVLRADYFSFILTKDGSGNYCLDDNTFPFGSAIRAKIFFPDMSNIKCPLGFIPPIVPRPRAVAG